MARDNFDESKNKKKKKAATTTESQSSSVTKTNPTVNRVNDRAQGSTFLSGGGSTSSYQNQNQKPKTVKKPAAQKQTSTSTTPRQNTPQRTTDTGTGKRRYSRTEATEYNNNLKQTAARDSRTRARRTLNEVDDFARRTANRAATWEKENLSARNQMLDTQRSVRNQKVAERASERMQNKYGKQELSDRQKAFSDYTSGVIQRKALGYAKTASDLLKTNEGYKAQGRWAQEDPEFARRISSHEFAKRADKAFNDYSLKQDEVQKRLSKIEDNASGAGKVALQAYGSGLEMGIDRLAGPMWAASMFASAYGNQRGQALKEGASDEQDSRAAFLGAGVEVATEYMFKPVAGIASKFGGKHSMDFAGKLAAKITSKLTGNKARIADIAVRTLGSQIEEGLEEVAGWAVDPYIQNAAYKNDLQKKKEADAHADYNDMQQSFWNQFDTEEEAQQAALYVNSDEFIDDQVKTYKESGATDEEARSMAKILQKYFLAHFDNDEEAAEEAETEMDRFVVGDVREKHDWKELGQTLASTFLLTGVTGGASTYYTNQIGNQMLQGEVGKDRVKQYTDIVIKYDPDNAKDAKYVKDTIDNGGTPTGTQVYQVASQATEVLQDMGKREMASDQVKQRRMRDEDLRVVPVVMTTRGPQFNEMTGKAYQASYDKALGVVRGVRKHGTDVGLSEDTLTSPEVMRTAANAVAAYETGTITAEQINDLTIDNPEIRTIFELATGVDLAQYNVMKRGKIDEVASNNAMMNGLLANAADNYAQMARAEQKQWSNRTRGRVLNAMSTSFGEKGNLAMHDVLKAADPRDQQKYMLTARIAQNVYDYARRTDISWEKMKNAYKGSFKNVDIDAMKDVYDAAKMDKDKAETAYLGREVIAGEAMRFEKSDKGVAMVTGQFSNDSARELTGEEDEAMRAVADRLGVNIRIVPDSEMTIDGRMSAGENAENVPHFNGSYDSATNTILLAETNGLNDNILYAMSHETTHLLKQYAPDAYMKLSNYIMDKYYKSAPGKYEAAIKAKQDLYKRAVNQDLSEEAALEEIIADATRDFWSDPEFVNQISNDIKDPGFFKSIVNAIRDMLRHIRNLLSSGHFDGTEHEDVLWDLLGTYSKAEKLWLDAYRQAARNRAQMAIDELQDKANKQNEARLSVSDEEIERIKAKKRTNKRDREILRDAGEKLKENDFYNLYTAHIINLGGKGKNADQMVESIKENGFKGSGGFGVNLVDSSINNISRQTEEEIRADLAQYDIPKERIDAKIDQLKGITSGPNRWIDGAYYEGINVTVDRYGGRKGQTVMLVPEHHTTDDRSLVENGFKPFDYEVVKVERDFQPYYELYSKAYDEAHEDRYSITPQQDADYMSAVERGDMETAQRMVDEAAAAAMPHTKLKGRWYHGTENEFTVFNFSQGGKNGTADGYGIYLTNDPKVAESYGQRMIEGYVNVERPASGLTSQTLTDIELHRLISRTVDVEAETLMYDEGYDNAGDAKKDTWISNYTNTHEASSLDQAIDDVIKTITQFNGNDFDIIQEIMNGMGIRDYEQATAFYDILTEETGIDGFETKWGDESEMADPNTPTIALAFRSEQIKDASPVTYDDDGKPIPLSERFNTENEDIRYSLTPEQQQRDADYMAAVNSGNMDEAQRLVDEAAILAGFDTDVYHGTRDFGFTQIKTSDLESMSDGGYYEWSPFFATDSIDTAQTYSSTYDIRRIGQPAEPFDEEQFDKDFNDSVFSIISEINRFAGIYNYMDYNGNPFNEAFDKLVNSGYSANEVSEELGDNVAEIISEIAWMKANDEAEANPDEDIDVDEYADEIQESEEADDIWQALGEVTSRLNTYYENMYGDASYGNYALKANLDNMMRIDAKGSKWNGISAKALTDVTGEEQSLVDFVNTRTAAAYARDHGYDGIQIDNLFDDGGKGNRQYRPSTIYIFFKPESQVKSSDPVTYREDGSVIPLSERFDPNNNDIRYSLPTQDADGKILTDGQMEYFKNSQARDIFGRLVPVYHTTNYGGFTIFDPSYSDDKRSLFFASNWDVSQTYGGRDSNRPIDISRAKFNSWADFEAIAQERFANAPGWDENKSVVENVEPWIMNLNTVETDDISFEEWLEIGNKWSDPHDATIRIPNEDGFWEAVNAASPKELLNRLSEKMGMLGDQRGYYSCYLNLQNPLIVDAQNQSWNNIPYGEYSEDAVLAIKNLTVQDMGDGIYVNIWGERKIDGEWQEFRDSDTIEFEYLTVDGEYEIPEKAWDEVYDFLVKHGLSSDYAYEHSDAFFDFNGLDTFDEDGRKVESDVRRYRTRELAALAETKGCDGVIIRNCYDIGAASHLKGEGLSDIYIAFRSNQVKDINNENPTENPDIRYSIPDEDMVKSYIEQNVEDIHDIPLVDFMLEQNRQNLIAAEEAFQANVSERWNRKSESYIAALDDPQAKASLRSIMREVRKNSGTKKQYKSETLEQVLKDVKQMHKYARANNAEMFAKTAWEAAEKIIDDIDYNDDLYEKYVGVKKYLDKARIVVPEEYFYMQDFAEFARSIQGFVRFYADGISLEKAYGQLSKKYPDLFPSDVNNAVDMLMQIADVIDYTIPYRETYSSEEYSGLVEEVASNLCALVENGKDYKTTIEKLKVDAMNQRHQEALRKAETRHQEQLDESNARTEAQRQRAEKWKQRYNDRVQKGIKDRKERSEREDHKKYFTRIQKNYNKLCDWVLKPTKEKNVPEEFRKSLAEFLQTLDLQTENSKKLEAKTGHVGQKTLKLRELKDRLNALAQSKTTEDGDYISGGFEIDAYAAHLMDILSDKYDGKSVDELDALAIRDIDVVLKTIIKNIQRYKQVKTETKMAEISDVGGRGVEFLKNKIDRDGPYSKRKGVPGALQTINATALTPPYLFDRLGPIKEMYDALRHNGFDTYIRNEKMIIDRLSDILGKYNRTNRKGQNMPGSIVEEWRDERSAQTIQLTYGSVTMSVAQMMSLYCLSKRGEQALGHMLVGGIKTTPIQTTSKIAADEKEKMGKAARLAKRTKNAAGNYVKSRIKGETETAEKLVLTYDDVQTIISKLTPDQKDVADKLQNLMSVDMAKLGNEAHRELYGYEMFDEDFYFPIKVDSNQRETDINTIGEVFEKIKSFGFAKPLTPNANKAIIIDDIFSIVADHCNGMNLYNSYLVPITDFMKVLNYTHTFEDGTTLSMKDAIEQAYGKDMLKYVLNLMKDINGIKAENRGGLEGLMNKAIGKAKKTAVFGNVRVALQQPTAIVRAAMEINPKYLKGVSLPQTVASYAPVARYTSKAMEEMWKYCPIAQWKAWGYYDTYMGKDIEDVMMNNWSIGDDILSGYYGQLDNATWAIIWQAVKAEQADLHKDMDTSSEEFLQMCGRRASEVFDKTQVVDSTFHRSDAMRSKQVAVKIFTAFMAEPTLTLNVFRAGLYNSSEEWKAGNKGKAKKILGKAVLTIIAQGILVSAAQAFADAWRGKDPGLPWGDDDDDEEKAGYWTRWVHNFVYNCFDQLHLENNMYLVKDVTPYINYMISMGADHWNWNPTLRAVMGWDQDYLYSQNTLVFAALENTANGMSQAFKKLEKGDEYVDYKTKEPKRWYDINQKIASGIGTLIGFPAGTVMRDFKPIWDKIFPVVFAADTELMDNIANKMGYKPIEGSSRSTSPDNTDKSSVSTSDEEGETNVPTRESLPDDLTDEQKDEIIKSAEKRSKKATPEEEQGQLDYDTMLYNALKAASGLEGEEYNKKVYSSVANGLKGYIADGDYVSIGMMRTVIEEAGGDVEYFDKRVMEESKTAYKRVLSYDQTLEERNNMKAMYRYMMSHGMTQEELSNDVLYSSELAKDMKVAYRFGDNNMIYEAMLPLVDAGITRTDLERLYENRNKMDLAKYKKTGRYKDKLKSMGTFIWPATGPITSHFGYRTDVASVGGSTDHPAIDIGIPVGTPVVAADGGVVILAGSNYGYGYSVGIKHDNGMVTYYNHLDSWNVKVGDTVAQGQQIACSGNTGRSTGPHLDFKILDKNGKPVNPEKILSGSI